MRRAAAISSSAFSRRPACSSFTPTTTPRRFTRRRLRAGSKGSWRSVATASISPGKRSGSWLKIKSTADGRVRGRRLHEGEGRAGGAGGAAARRPGGKGEAALRRPRRRRLRRRDARRGQAPCRAAEGCRVPVHRDAAAERPGDLARARARRRGGVRRLDGRRPPPRPGLSAAARRRRSESDRTGRAPPRRRAEAAGRRRRDRAGPPAARGQADHLPARRGRGAHQAHAPGPRLLASRSARSTSRHSPSGTCCATSRACRASCSRISPTGR